MNDRPQLRSERLKHSRDESYEEETKKTSQEHAHETLREPQSDEATDQKQTWVASVVADQ